MSAGEEQKQGKGGMVALILLTLIAGGAGAGHGIYTFKSMAPPVQKPAEAKAPAKAAHAEPAHGAPAAPGQKPKLPSKIVSRDLPPLITNIQLPPDMWVRVEGALVFDQAEVDNPEMLASEISADLLGYLRTLTLREIQGADGLMFLRQDLKERIALRSEKKVRDFVIQALVVQ